MTMNSNLNPQLWLKQGPVLEDKAEVVNNLFCHLYPKKLKLEGLVSSLFQSRVLYIIGRIINPELETV